MQVVIESLLENTSTQIVYLAQHDLLDRLAKLFIFDLRFLRVLGEPGGLEGARQMSGWHILV